MRSRAGTAWTVIRPLTRTMNITQTIGSAHIELTVRRPPAKRDVVRVVSGNFLEMFDFMVYGFYAAAVATAVFPSDNEFVSLMLSLMTFGGGFLIRPLGA